MQSYTSRIARLLTNDTEVWQKIPPNWLNGPKLLMLDDMITSRENGNSLHIDDNYESICNICNISTNHPTYHWLTECIEYRAQVQELIKSLHGCSNIEEALHNRMHCQRVLRVLAKIALRSEL